MKVFLAPLLLCSLLPAVTRLRAAEPPAPLSRAHSHNDYEQARPLFDALDRGFLSVEADVHAVDGKLLVAHDRDDTRPDRTLEALYLDPLAALVAQRKSVLPSGGGGEFTLLIDLKTEGAACYSLLRPLLEARRDILTEYADGAVTPRAVRVILSGDSPRSVLAAETRRLAFIDGRLGDLETNPPATLVPLISDNWLKHFQWRGQGPISPEENRRLLDFTVKAHAQGRRIRFWATGHFLSGWDVLTAAKVDLIGADQLDLLRDYLLRHPARAPLPE